MVPVSGKRFSGLYYYKWLVLLCELTFCFTLNLVFMLGFYVDFIDDIVNSVKRNPGGSTAAALAGWHLYGTAITAAGPVVITALLAGGAVYGVGKLLSPKD